MKILSDRTPLSKKLLAISIVFLFSGITVSPVVSSELSIQNNINSADLRVQGQELDLLRGEYYLFVNATENVDSFHIRYAFPPDYNYQVPIMLEILNDSTAQVLHYKIESDTYEPNKVVNFTIGPLAKGSLVSLHFYYWVLVENNNYSDLPGYVKIPKKYELPDATKQWLSSTDVVQSKNILIRLKAHELKGHTTNLLVLAQRIVDYVKWHRYLFFCLQLYLGTLKGQDALTTLFRNGDCPGRSHLSTAFFRANGVPARVIMAIRHYSFWFQMHFMTELYCPGYGWILADVDKAVVPYEAKNQIIMRICSPQDEDNTGHDFFFPKMIGIERWFWIDNNHVIPYYKDLVEGSKLNMFPEQSLSTDSVTADFAFSLTEMVFMFYEQYLGSNLGGENLQYFQNAVAYQKQAILELKQSQDLNGYLSLLNLAYTEYAGISI
ncbi:Transglutaminase-like superfamily protein [uncultured archaeon]|nr:Transglutaminase-like superfamily protein [uncultured archaeon]